MISALFKQNLREDYKLEKLFSLSPHPSLRPQHLHSYFQACMAHQLINVCSL